MSIATPSRYFPSASEYGRYALTDIQTAAIQILVDRALEAKVKELNMATPKLQGLASAIHKLHHGLEDRADKLHQRIADADTKADSVFKNAHTKMDGIEGHVGDVERFLDEIEGSNGPPLRTDLVK